MKPSTTVERLTKYLPWIVILVLVLLPFHAFLTVWLSQGFGHYTVLRLWKELLLVILLSGSIYFLLKDSSLKQKFFSSMLVKMILVYLALILAISIIGALTSSVSAKAALYGLLIDTRFFIFFLVCLILAAKTNLQNLDIKKWILLPAALVSVVAILQYFILPYDFLKHFGYGEETIYPYQTINHDINYIRAMSTMRGANPLGAYMLMIISVGLAFLLSKKKESKKYLSLGVAAYTAALILSFSRSAWIGAVLSVAVIIWLSVKTKKSRNILAGLALIILCTGFMSAYVLRNNTALDNAIFHTNDKSLVARSSNEDHASASSGAMRDIAHKPLGEGVGSAGPASVYNKDSAKLAENYFLQIGQEAGLIGMGLFIVINIMAGRLLWIRKENPLALALFASLVGLTFVNLLSHAWADDTLSYIFWGLAGIALTPVILKTKEHKQKK